MKFPRAVSKELKYYVYIYSNPLTDEIFYVGKGKGNRVFSHLEDRTECEKTQYLDDLKNDGLEPNIEILIHGIDDENTALKIESSIIDLIGIGKLTNKQSGYKSAVFGRMTIEQIISTYDRKSVDIVEPGIMIRINQAFRYTMSEIELYDYTRGQWVINPERAQNAHLAFAIYEGVIQEVYSVIDWFEAGTTFNIRKEDNPIKGRYEFIGNIAREDIRNKYKYKSVEHYFKKGNSNPIMYVNC